MPNRTNCGPTGGTGKIGEYVAPAFGELRQYPNEKLAYEILNEAVAKDSEDWNKVFNKVLAAIRTREPGRIIVLGSNMWQGPKHFRS